MDVFHSERDSSAQVQRISSQLKERCPQLFISSRLLHLDGVVTRPVPKHSLCWKDWELAKYNRLCLVVGKWALRQHMISMQVALRRAEK